MALECIGIAQMCWKPWWAWIWMQRFKSRYPVSVGFANRFTPLIIWIELNIWNRFAIRLVPSAIQILVDRMQEVLGFRSKLRVVVIVGRIFHLEFLLGSSNLFLLGFSFFHFRLWFHFLALLLFLLARLGWFPMYRCLPSRLFLLGFLFFHFCLWFQLSFFASFSSGPVRLIPNVSLSCF